MKAIAVSIAHDLIDELLGTAIVFHHSTIEVLSELTSPRIIQKYIEDALERALMGERDIVYPKDIEISTSSKTKVGFL